MNHLLEKLLAELPKLAKGHTLRPLIDAVQEIASSLQRMDDRLDTLETAKGQAATSKP